MIFPIVFVFGFLLFLASFVQLLYLESLRLITRESEALAFFKETLQRRLGFETEEGAFVFSLIKHTLLVLCGALFVAAAAARGEGWSGFLEGFLLAWLVMMAAAYVLPQMLYRRSSGQWALPFVPFLKFLTLLFKPLTLLMGFLQSLFELGSPAPAEDRPEPGEEIDALLSAGEEEGIIEKEDSRLIQNIVAFGDKRVREVMTPRPSIIAIEASESLDSLRKLARDQQFSRIPVYESCIDRILGFVHVRDLYELDDAQRASSSLRALMRPIEAVPETMPVARLLREMQERGIHIVYVVDEYGRLAGLATMEDLVEEVFGEIRDEHEPQHDVLRSPDGSITVSGAFDLDHLHEMFDFRPEDGTESTTVGGLAAEWAGAIPKPGETIERYGLRIEIISADDYRVDKVRISPVPPPPEEPKEPS